MPTRRATKTPSANRGSKSPAVAKTVSVRASKPRAAASVADERDALQWRLDRLEQQMLRLTELIREHAEDNDRLVRIVAEDRELIRKELVRRHQAQLRARDLLRRMPS